MNRRLKYVPMLCVCLIGMLVSCGTVKRTSGVSGNKAVVEEKDPLTPEQRRKYDYFFLEALRMKEKGDLDAAFEMYSQDRKSTRLNSSHIEESRMPSSA